MAAGQCSQPGPRRAHLLGILYLWTTVSVTTTTTAAAGFFSSAPPRLNNNYRRRRHRNLHNNLSPPSFATQQQQQQQGLGRNTQRFRMYRDGSDGLNGEESSSNSFSDENLSSSLPSPSLLSKPNETKYRMLKDLMWVRETLEDLTAAEFALSVEGAVEATESEETGKKKRDVDYEKLLNQLNRRLRDMGCTGVELDPMIIAATEENDYGNDNVLSDPVAPLNCDVEPGMGMGSSVYDDEQRGALLERLARTRELLIRVVQRQASGGIKGGSSEEEKNNVEETFSIPDLPEFGDLEVPSLVDIPKEPLTQSNDEDSVVSDATAGAGGPKLYVREDGTVDWDGALQDQAALRKFGTSVWARINGRDPEEMKGEDTEDPEATKTKEKTGPTAKIPETPEIKKEALRLSVLESELAQMEASQIALLSSSLAAGQAVANVNLATLEPAQRSEIQFSVKALEKKKEEVAFQRLILELERIYSYLVREVGNPALNGYIPLQDRLNVAEFGLLESQIDSFQTLVLMDDDGYNETIATIAAGVDEDVLAVVMEQVTDLKRRLGIDYYVAGFSWDSDAVRVRLKSLLEQLRKSVAFYIKGCRLLWDDLVFCLSLVNRAAQGYTLKPREVRTLRYVFYA